MEKLLDPFVVSTQCLWTGFRNTGNIVFVVIADQDSVKWQYKNRKMKHSALIWCLGLVWEEGGFFGGGGKDFFAKIEARFAFKCKISQYSG